MKVKLACNNCGKLLVSMKKAKKKRKNNPLLVYSCPECDHQNTIDELLGEILKGEFVVKKRLGKGSFGFYHNNI